MDIEKSGEIVDRYLQGTATAEEREWVEKWLQLQPEDHQSLDARQRETIHARLWQSFTHKTDWASFASSARVRRLYPVRRYLGYTAAVMLIVSGVYWLTTTPRSHAPALAQTVTALPGSHKTMLLPDSSIAHLFPGATLTIPDDFNTNDRRVALTGRAFFEVRPDLSRPFYVQSGKLRTQVTKFHVG